MIMMTLAMMMMPAMMTPAMTTPPAIMTTPAMTTTIMSYWITITTTIWMMTLIKSPMDTWAASGTQSRQSLKRL